MNSQGWDQCWLVVGVKHIFVDERISKVECTSCALKDSTSFQWNAELGSESWSEKCKRGHERVRGFMLNEEHRESAPLGPSMERESAGATSRFTGFTGGQWPPTGGHMPYTHCKWKRLLPMILNTGCLQWRRPTLKQGYNCAEQTKLTNTKFHSNSLAEPRTEMRYHF